MATALERIAARAGGRRDESPRCDLCATPLEEQHRHVFDFTERSIRCACRACGVLFDVDGAGGVHYRAVPQRRIRFDPADTRWEQLPAPVGLVFYVRRSDTGRIAGAYPSPLGITESELDMPMWSALEEAFPALRSLQDDVEALLLYRHDDTAHVWIVPIDDCYRLAATVRSSWRGFTGGDVVWQEIDAFFSELGTKEDGWATSA
jgi:hypothetical protein